jgi:hypothetical protein
MDIQLPVKIERQPDYTTCGPTSLHAVYSYFGDPITLEQVIEETHKLEGGGTISVHLAVHALRRGYTAETWICNVGLWDPTWFQKETDLKAKLGARAQAKNLLKDARNKDGMAAIEEYLDRGGKVRWGDLSPETIRAPLAAGLPILTGTNGTYLYQCAREGASGPDDVGGDPFGHFIVVCGYNAKDKMVSVADPLMDNPAHGTKYYRASVHRLIGAIFLGAATNDSNFLVLRPPKGMGPPAKRARSKKTIAAKPVAKKTGAKKAGAKKPSAKARAKKQA